MILSYRYKDVRVLLIVNPITRLAHCFETSPLINRLASGTMNLQERKNSSEMIVWLSTNEPKQLVNCSDDVQHRLRHQRLGRIVR